MAFQPKDWRDNPDHSTPITAAALEDLETRVTDYADSVQADLAVVHDIRSFSAGVGQGDSAVDTAAVNAAVAELLPADGGSPMNQVLFFPDADYYFDDRFGGGQLHASLGIVGGTPYGTRFHITDDFPDGTPLIDFEYSASDSPVLGDGVGYAQLMVPNPVLRNFSIDGDGRTRHFHGIRFRSAAWANIENVKCFCIRGSALIAHNFLESPIYNFDTFYCGTDQEPTLDMYEDEGDSEDGSNLLSFMNCQIGLSCGDHLHVGRADNLGAVRAIYFNSCVFHGNASQYSRGYETLFGTFEAYDDAFKARLVVQSANVYFSNCSGYLNGRGQPMVQTKASELGLVNDRTSVYIGDGCYFQPSGDPYEPLTVTAVAASDTLELGTFQGTFASGHWITSGSKVQVSGTLPAPLAALTDYYAIRVDTNTLKLATSRANALAGTAINITGGTTEFTLTPQDQSIESVSAAANTLTITDHRLSTEARVRVYSTGTLPAPLVDTPGGSDPAGADYFVIRVDKDTIKLATTRANAEAGTAIDLTNAGSGNHYLTIINFVMVHEGNTLDIGRIGISATVDRALIRQEQFTNVNVDPSGHYPDGDVVERWDGGPLVTAIRGAQYLADGDYFAIELPSGGLPALAISRNPILDHILLGGATGKAHDLGLQVQAGRIIFANVGGNPKVWADDNGIVFNGKTAGVVPDITGTAPTGVTLQILQALDALGLVTDSTT